MSNEKNPLFIPASDDRPSQRTTGCPKCEGDDYTARKVQGMLLFTCLNSECKNTWAGGLPIEPHDPRRPLPATNYRPPLEFVADHRSRDGFSEIARRPDLRPNFRTGIPEGENE